MLARNYIKNFYWFDYVPRWAILPNVNNKDSMDELNKIIDRYTEGNYLISKTDKEEMAKDILSLFGVVGQSEQLVCPGCKQPFTKEELKAKEHCFNCGWEFAN